MRARTLHLLVVFCGVVGGLAAPLTARVASAGGIDTGSIAATGRILIAHQPRAPILPSGASTSSAGWTSSNWSGYAITGGHDAFKSVAGSWVVPTVSPSQVSTFSSSWLGIDGFNNSNLIQTGTEQDYYVGSAHYFAWWEILPASEAVITAFSVQPGDRITASIHKNTTSVWTISITDSRSGSFAINRNYQGLRSSVEWIEEAPNVNGGTARLAHYGAVTFDPGTVNGANPGLTAADAGVMVQHGTHVSTPSSPDSDTDGFSCAYGSSSPPPPPS